MCLPQHPNRLGRETQALAKMKKARSVCTPLTPVRAAEQPNLRERQRDRERQRQTDRDSQRWKLPLAVSADVRSILTT